MSRRLCHLRDCGDLAPQGVQTDIRDIDSVNFDQTVRFSESEQGGDERRLPGPCSTNDTDLQSRREGMSCWGTGLADCCSVAAEPTGGTLTALPSRCYLTSNFVIWKCRLAAKLPWQIVSCSFECVVFGRFIRKKKLFLACYLFVRFDGKVHVTQDHGEGGVVGVAEPLGPDGAVRGPVLGRVLRLVVALRL